MPPSLGRGRIATTTGPFELILCNYSLKNVKGLVIAVKIEFDNQGLTQCLKFVTNRMYFSDTKLTACHMLFLMLNFTY